MPSRLSLAALIALAALAGGPAAAHGLGQRYDLPLPLDFYMVAGALVVALSFAVMAYFARRGADGGTPAAGTIDLPGPALAGPIAHFAADGVRLLALAAFLLIVAAGLFGNQDPFRNLAPVSVWVLGWVGIAFASALIGNVWAVLNPFDAAFRLVEAGLRRRRSPRPVPARWGVWPAVVLFAAFAWAELVWPARDRPAALATLMLVYAALTWLAMWRYGRPAWLATGEVFTVAFGLLARFAPSETTPAGGLRLRPLAGGLAPRRPVSWSLSAFVLLMLASVTFDGLMETPPWAGLARAAVADPVFASLAGALAVAPYPLLQTLGLLAAPLAFAALYLGVCAWMAAAARRAGVPAGTGEMARLFVLTLVPIAVAYHLAHYLSYLLIAGQFVIPLISDPFGRGWDLFGTALYLIDIGVIDARTAWYAALALIVTGHVIAVALAHIVAVRYFANARAALRSQVPMLILMVAYTAVSLWILAQPIAEFSPG